MRSLSIAVLIFVLLLGIGVTQTGIAHRISSESFGYNSWMEECWGDYADWNGGYAYLLDNPYLNLSTDQIKKITSLDQKFQKEAISLRNDRRAKRLELRALKLAEQPDLDEIQAKLEEISKVELQLHKKMVEYQAEIHDFLTPTQLSKLYDDHLMECCGMRMGWMCW